MIGKLFRTFLVGMHTAFIEMGKHKLRSALSMLGVMLGVTALVAMLSLIGGIQTFLEERMGRWAGALWIWKDWHATDEDKLAWARSPGLRLQGSRGPRRRTCIARLRWPAWAARSRCEAGHELRARPTHR